MNRLTEFFDDMKMPENCARRIESAMEEKQRMPKKEEYTMRKSVSEPRRGWSIGLAAMFLVLVAAAGVLVLQAGGDGEAVATAPTADTEMIETLEQIRQTDRDTAEDHRENERLREIVEGRDIVCENTELRDGRVYLTYEGKEYDITDGITEELASRIREDGCDEERIPDGD